MNSMENQPPVPASSKSSFPVKVRRIPLVPRAVAQPSTFPAGSTDFSAPCLGQEICETYLSEQTKFSVNPKYLFSQPNMSAKLRILLIDWIIINCERFELRPETLHLAVNLIDRYLEKKGILRKHAQLVGVVCLLLASKYEEIYPLSLKNIMNMTENCYSRAQVFRLESEILRTLNFELTCPSAYHFLERYAETAGLTGKVLSLSRYVAELSLLEVHMLKYSFSLIAAASVYLSCKTLGEDSHWTFLSEPGVKSCAKDLYVFLATAPHSSLSGAYEKYSKSVHHEVAKIII